MSNDRPSHLPARWRSGVERASSRGNLFLLQEALKLATEPFCCWTIFWRARELRMSRLGIGRHCQCCRLHCSKDVGHTLVEDCLYGPPREKLRDSLRQLEGEAYRIFRERLDENVNHSDSARWRKENSPVRLAGM